MKLLLSLLLPALAHSLTCPDPLEHEYNVTEELTMYFDVVLSEPNVTDGSILCARFESLTTGWIGFGINPSGVMVGAEAVIGIPANNTVKKYILFAEDISGVVAMDEEKQTLMDTSITQDGEGRTTMSFTKYLFEDRYGIIPSDFINSFIWATGSSNQLDYHGGNRGSFGLNLLTTLSPTPVPPTTVPATLAPSVVVTTATTEGKDGTPSPSVVVTDEILAEGSTSPTMTVTGNELVDISLSPTAALTTSAPDSAETTSSPSKNATMDTAAVQPTGSPAAEVPATGSPVAEAKLTGSPIVEVSTASLQPAETEENATTSTPSATGNETDTAPGLGFAESDSSSVDASERDTSGACSFTIGIFLLAAGMILNCVLGL
ncbi:hypothetical protein HJC23_012260 [Cyclotella cryptica]|uniref:DOMON domain-containing protein n=1 Tax=Cyclotella cryptica TaxID=29204 RepID=A0ABD3PPC1_9STRA|eukprot:CCRYP_013209-RA/>CCRYP_013209-RA protein AED:0.18 eAED:0.18 QI:0/-1/0/1/-1/1/1/0/375